MVFKRRYKPSRAYDGSKGLNQKLRAYKIDPFRGGSGARDIMGGEMVPEVKKEAKDMVKRSSVQHTGPSRRIVTTQVPLDIDSPRSPPVVRKPYRERTFTEKDIFGPNVNSEVNIRNTFSARPDGRGMIDNTHGPANMSLTTIKSIKSIVDNRFQ